MKKQLEEKRVNLIFQFDNDEIDDEDGHSERTEFTIEIGSAVAMSQEDLFQEISDTIEQKVYELEEKYGCFNWGGSGDEIIDLNNYELYTFAEESSDPDADVQTIEDEIRSVLATNSKLIVY